MAQPTEGKVRLVGIDYQVGPNRVAHTGSWGVNNLFAYGAGCNIAIYNPEKCKITTMLRGHTDRVNCVRWVHNTVISDSFAERWFNPENILVSGGADHRLIVWTQDQRGEWIVTNKLKEHKDSITSLSSLLNPDGSILVSSTSADNTTIVWKREAGSNDFKVLQRLEHKPKMMECSAMSHIPNTETPVLALGGVDSLIHVYIQNDQGNFVRVVQLQGHEDWIRGVEFALCDDGDLLLASCSQDTKIRLWRLGKVTADTENMLASLRGKSEGVTSLSSKGHLFNYRSTKYQISLESVLSAHEEWVYSARWAFPTKIDGKYHQDLCLVSASMDRSMIMWSFSPSSGVWIDQVKVGEVGGNTLGFYGGFLSRDGHYLLAHGYNGSLHMWSDENPDRAWRAHIVPSGHFAPVMDMDWDSEGDYLLSVSEDQTARCFSEWREKGTWHEIARPAVHGHDFNCISFLNGRDHSFVAGAEEKVIRLFDAPQTFVDTLSNISHVQSQADSNRPLGANVPPLGLSNKPIVAGEDSGKFKEENEYDVAPAPAPVTHQVPPLEEHLFQSTLWPEIQKLYGHPNEMVAVCSSRSGHLIASACKGSQPDESSIRVWDTKTWKEISKLTVHKLSVAQLEFSHDDTRLLSVSRDRSFCIFKMGDDRTIEVEKFFKSAHERIIWSGAWSHDDRFIATGSRDKMVKLWVREENDWKNISSLPAFSCGVTSVCWLSFKSKRNTSTLAVGLEDGSISIWMVQDDGKNEKVYELPQESCHGEAIRRMRWRQKKSLEGRVQLASCSMDHSVRVHSFEFEE
ncbi:elongator complex protein 2 [Planoprotostelium fungivorum]|uniref:Elongator complex protein 2 n=1 Tax=Planoprotostelium fungivorum TaxID=1890364 RepID=A0A2P6NRG4_9EUKA|nr:elongator complex protein 2 [Planoprotostelium fungivorum]